MVKREVPEDVDAYATAMHTAKDKLVSALCKLPNWDAVCDCDESEVEYMDLEGDGGCYDLCLKCGGDIQ